MKRLTELPRFVHDLLAGVPRHGEGVHNWLFRMARVLHPYREEDEIAAILSASTVGCGRVVIESEIQDAIRNSEAVAWRPGNLSRIAARSQPAWPAVNRGQCDAIIASGAGLYDLWEYSPVRFEDAEAHTERIVDTLFPGNPWLCVGASNSEFKTRHRDELRGELSALALIVPSPMTAQTGTTKDGKTSEHTLDNTGARKFLVCEFDPRKWEDLSETEREPSGCEQMYYDTKRDEQAAILLHLAERAPLALTVHSAGKSLQGWFHCAGQCEELTRRFMRYAVSLGADPATWTRSQFVRCPDGTRDNGKRQTVYFFNPASMEGAR